MINYEEQLFVDREKKFLGFQKLLQPTTRQSVMLIEAPQDMGKSWLVSKMQRYCQMPAAEIPVAQLDFRNPRQIHEIQDFLGLVRFIRDRLAAPHIFSNLNATINSFTEAGVGNNRGLATLRQNIENAFNLDELQNLAFDLGIKYENLPGETIRAKSRELVNYCQRHALLRLLVELCAQLRDRVDWWAGLDWLRRQAAASATADDAETPVADNNAPIWADSDMERQRAEQQINSAFFECLAMLLEERERVALLFDSIEVAPPEAVRWLCDELLARLRDGQLDKVVVIVTGRKTPDLSDLDINQLLVETDLDPFTEEHVREYFEKRRNLPPLDWRTILLTSGGVPGVLAMMADHAMATASDDDDFFSDL